MFISYLIVEIVHLDFSFAYIVQVRWQKGLTLTSPVANKVRFLYKTVRTNFPNTFFNLLTL